MDDTGNITSLSADYDEAIRGLEAQIARLKTQQEQYSKNSSMWEILSARIKSLDMILCEKLEEYAYLRTYYNERRKF